MSSDQLWLANADRRNARQVARGGLPAWSPDGKWFAIAPQSEGGALLAAPNLSSVGWLHEELTCVTVARQPAIR